MKVYFHKKSPALTGDFYSNYILKKMEGRNNRCKQ